MGRGPERASIGAGGSYAVNRTDVVDLFRRRGAAIAGDHGVVTLHHRGVDVLLVLYEGGGEVREARLDLEALLGDDWRARVEAQLWPSCPVADTSSARAGRELQLV